MKYKLTIGKHTRFEHGRAVRYQTGDVFEPTEAELVTIGERLEPVVEKVEEDPTGSENESENTGEGDQTPAGEPEAEQTAIDDQAPEDQGAKGGFVPAGTVFLIGEDPQSEQVQTKTDSEPEGEQPAAPPAAEPKPKRQPRKKSEE